MVPIQRFGSAQTAYAQPQLQTETQARQSLFQVSSTNIRFQAHESVAGDALIKQVQQSPNAKAASLTKTVDPQAAKTRLQQSSLALVQSDGSRLEINGFDVMRIIDSLHQKNVDTHTDSDTSPHTGIFYHQLTGLFQDKQLLRVIPNKEKDAIGLLKGLMGEKKQSLDGWTKAKPGHDLRITLNHMLKDMEALGWLKMGAWLPAEKVAGGLLTVFPQQHENLYLVVTPKGKAQLASISKDDSTQEA